MTLTSWTTWVTRACEKSRASASCDSQLTDASATGATSKILRGRMFMGAFIVCAPAFVKSFLQAFLASAGAGFRAAIGLPHGGFVHQLAFRLSYRRAIF